MVYKSNFLNLDEIETDRLKIRKITLKDAEDIFEFTSLPETCEILSWYPHQNIDVTKKFLKSIIIKYKKNEPAQWALELKENKKVIGIAGFINIDFHNKRGEIAYVLSPFYQNKGLMTEALKEIIRIGFNRMDLIRIEAKCEIDNFASERVMQKIGMRLEGCFYNYIIRKGKPRHYKIYSILNEEI